MGSTSPPDGGSAAGGDPLWVDKSWWDEMVGPREPGDDQDPAAEELPSGPPAEAPRRRRRLDSTAGLDAGLDFPSVDPPRRRQPSPAAEPPRRRRSLKADGAGRPGRRPDADDQPTDEIPVVQPADDLPLDPLTDDLLADWASAPRTAEHTDIGGAHDIDAPPVELDERGWTSPSSTDPSSTDPDERGWSDPSSAVQEAGRPAPPAVPLGSRDVLPSEAVGPRPGRTPPRRTRATPNVQGPPSREPRPLPPPPGGWRHDPEFRRRLADAGLVLLALAVIALVGLVLAG